MDIKALEKLAKACRKAGISYFKNEEFEFKLDANPQPARKRNNKQSLPMSNDDAIASEDSLTQDQLLFYSVADIDVAKGQ
jgi:hypothetical protein